MTPSVFVNSFFQNIIDKRVDDVINSYAKSEDIYVILEGPRLSTKGITRISEGWKDFCNSTIKVFSIDWIDGPYTRESYDMSSVIGIINMKGMIKDKEFEIVYRASFVLINDEPQFKIFHEHISGALSDPYGIGDWKK